LRSVCLTDIKWIGTGGVNLKNNFPILRETKALRKRGEGLAVWRVSITEESHMRVEFLLSAFRGLRNVEESVIAPINFEPRTSVTYFHFKVVVLAWCGQK
jgi:hypothetical protein